MCMSVSLQNPTKEFDAFVQKYSVLYLYDNEIHITFVTVSQTRSSLFSAVSALSNSLCKCERNRDCFFDRQIRRLQ